jgi:hypothetical protein
MKDLTPYEESENRSPCCFVAPFVNRLVTRTPRLGNDLGHLVNLPLRTAEGTELFCVSACSGGVSEVVDVPSS